jgi:CubicO group peptidase (beta-lactamase class C family)
VRVRAGSPAVARGLPAGATVALAGAAGALGGFVTSSWWWLVPAAAALAVLAWRASPVAAGVGAWAATFMVAVAAAESPGGRPVRVAGFALYALAAAALAAMAAGRVRPAARVAGAVGLVAVFVFAGYLPGPSFPTTGGAEPAAPEAGLDAATVARIDDYVRDAMRARRVPGVALGVVRGDDVVLLRGYGVADLDRQPVTPETAFVMASVSKSFTALAIMQLVDAGDVDLDAPVHRYLPEFRVADEVASAEITVRDLLQHTTGLATSSGIGVLDRPEDHSLAEDVAAAADFGVIDPPGEKHHYSNRNFQIAGRVVEVVSGQSFDAYVEEHIFEPLGMDQTTASDAAAHATDLAQGYRTWFGVPVPYGTTVITGAVPAAGIASTAADMTHYLIAQLNRGRYDGEEVVSAGSVAAMHRPAVPVEDGHDAFDDGDDFYGLGWEIDIDTDHGDRISVAHGGTAPQYTASMQLRPQDGWGMILLANDQAAVAHPASGIGDGVMDLLLGDDAPDPGGGFVLGYLIVDLVTVLIVALLVRSATGLRRWQARLTRRRAIPVVLWALVVNLLVPFAILFVLPNRFDAWYGVTWVYAPAETAVLIGTAVALLALGAAKIVLAATVSRGSRAPVPATSPS